MRNLIEEFITQRKDEFSLKNVCSYVLYWAVVDGKVADEKNLIEGDELQQNPQERVKKLLDGIVADGRIANSSFEKYIKR